MGAGGVGGVEKKTDDGFVERGGEPGEWCSRARMMEQAGGHEKRTGKKDSLASVVGVVSGAGVRSCSLWRRFQKSALRLCAPHLQLLPAPSTAFGHATATATATASESRLEIFVFVRPSHAQTAGGRSALARRPGPAGPPSERCDRNLHSSERSTLATAEGSPPASQPMVRSSGGRGAPLGA